VPVVLDLAPLERHACDLIRYFRSCTEHWSDPRAGRGLQVTEHPQVSFPRQWLPFRRQFSPSLVRRHWKAVVCIMRFSLLNAAAHTSGGIATAVGRKGVMFGMHVSWRAM
jgi:hypothetical protein